MATNTRKQPGSNGAWSKVGKTALKRKQPFSVKKYAPLVVAIAVLGGFFVWRSLATTKLYPYQYSVSECGKSSTTAIDPADKCLNESAEAMTFRFYKGVLNRPPETVSTRKDKKGKLLPSGYAFWTQKFAGDRLRPTDLGTKMIASSKTASAKSNQAYIEGIYVGLLGRKADVSGLKYWKNQLDSKIWSRGKILAHFASQDSVVKATQAAFANFLAKAPSVKIVKTAEIDRDARLLKATTNANAAEKLYNAMKGYPNTAKTALSASKASSNKGAPGTNDLKAIGANEKVVRGLAVKTNSPRAKMIEYQRQNKLWYERAKVVADYSPDISADGIKKQYDRVVVYSKSAANVNSQLTGTIKEIAALYKVAEGKYEKNIIAKQKAAEEAARRAREHQGGGTGSTGGGDDTKDPGTKTGGATVASCKAKYGEDTMRAALENDTACMDLLITV